MTVTITHHHSWAEVALNRPERKNAITGPLGDALAKAVNVLAADDRVQVILLRGNGGSFCSGLDLKAFNAHPAPAWQARFPQIWRSAHKALFNCPKPIIGAMERYAINGGAALAIACDQLVVGESAFLQVGEAKLGMAAPYNLAWLTLRHSEATVADLVFEGERIPGPELVRRGLAREAVPDLEVLSHAQALCAKLADYPTGALARIKTGMRARMDDDADAWFDRFVQPGSGAAKPPLPK